MRKLMITALVVILLHSNGAVLAQPLAHAGGMTKLRHKAASIMLAGSLLFAPVLGHAQGDAEELQVHPILKKVLPTSPAYQKGVIFLHMNSEDKGWQVGLHTAFIGTDDDGNALLVGLHKPASFNMVILLEEPNVTVNLYGWNGLIRRDVPVKVVELAEHMVDDKYDMVIFAADVKLNKNYPNMQMAEFPLEGDEDVKLLTYLPNSTLPFLGGAERRQLEFGILSLFARSCSTTSPIPDLVKIGLSMSTCGLVDGAVAIGSPLVNAAGELIGFHGEIILDEVWWASATTRELRVVASKLTRGASPVDVADKMTTTWAAIKRR